MVSVLSLSLSRRMAHRAPTCRVPELPLCPLRHRVRCARADLQCRPLTWLWVVEFQCDLEHHDLLLCVLTLHATHSLSLSTIGDKGGAQTWQSLPPHPAGWAGAGFGSAFAPVLHTRHLQVRKRNGTPLGITFIQHKPT